MIADVQSNAIAQELFEAGSLDDNLVVADRQKGRNIRPIWTGCQRADGGIAVGIDDIDFRAAYQRARGILNHTADVACNFLCR